MKYYTEPSREIPVAAETEVLVVGGGPAGFGAALHAARMGRKTMLIEQYGAVGGVATTGIMSHWTGRQDGGCFEELREKARDCEAEQVINPEKLRILMLDMLMEAGVNVQLYTGFSDVIMEGNRVAGVITESKSGREAILSKMVIDSTGDGDVAARAGVPFEKGRSTEGDLQTLGRQELPSPAGHILLYPSSLPGVVTVNMSNMTDVDGTNARDLNRAEYVCRKQLPEIIAFLRRHVPGYEGCYLIDSADVIGVRETRRFEANYQLNEQDIAQARTFEDWVVTKSNFFFDLHNVEGAGLDANGEYKAFKQPKPYTIPLRCFVPKTVEGILLNGRNISGTHKAHSSYRVMPIVMNMGHAMGIVAAMCVAQNKKPLELDIHEVQDELRRTNVEP